MIVDIDNLDLGDLCPKFEIKGSEEKIEPPRKASNISVTQQANSQQVEVKQETPKKKDANAKTSS